MFVQDVVVVHSVLFILVWKLYPIQWNEEIYGDRGSEYIF